MDGPFATAEEHLEELLESTRQLRATLLRTETHYRRTLRCIRQGSGLTATVEATSELDR